MSDLSTMRTNVRTDIAIDPNGDIWPNARIDRYINEFIGTVYTWKNLDFGESTDTLTLVASTATYDLVAELTNYGKLISIKLDGRYQTLPEKSVLELENTVDLTTEGEPSYFYFYGPDTIGLYPVPDGIIASAAVRFERSSPTLSSDGDEPAFDSQWHHVCEKYALWRCFDTQIGFEAQAKKAFDIYRVNEAKMREDIWNGRDVGDLIMTNQVRVQWPV